MGGAALLRRLPIERAMRERDGYLALIAAALLLVFGLNGRISAPEGAVLALLYVAYTAFLVRSKGSYENAYHVRQFARYFFRFEYLSDAAQVLTRPARERAASPKSPFDWKNALMLLASVALIVAGGNLLVDKAVFFAGHLELPVTLVGVVLALGTTAPEMSVSIAAARQGMGGMVIGNAIGSVLCNTFLILGAASLVAPITVSVLALRYALPCLLGITLVLLVFKRTGHEIQRLEGAGLCLLYVAFLTGYALLV